MAAALGGIDALVFTAGIGEGSAARPRATSAGGSAFSASSSIAAANEGAVPDVDVSPAGAAVRVVVLHAREDVVAARAARALLA